MRRLHTENGESEYRIGTSTRFAPFRSSWRICNWRNCLEFVPHVGLLPSDLDADVQQLAL